MTFHEVRFPTAIALGATGGPERRTEIVELASGFEERNTPWAHSRRRYNAGYGIRSLDDLHAVIAFFEARRGRLHGFRWKDAADWKSCPPQGEPTPLDQGLGTGDGAATVFQLRKRYVSGPAAYDRPITKPVAGTLRVSRDGDELIEGTDFTLDPVTGRITFAAAPAPGAILTAGFAFDVPVRFDTDRLSINLAAFDAGEIPDIPLIELRMP